MNSSMLSRSLGFALLALALIGYSMPWLNGPAVSLSPSAYDLAEWMSLHPFVRSNGPLLLTALLLRLPLVTLGWLVVNHVRGPLGWGLAALWAVALLPPVDFFRGAFNDPNYHQQFVLLVVYGIGTVAILLRRWHARYFMSIAVSTAIVAVIGLVWSWRLFSIYEVAMGIGVGGVVFALALLAYAANLWQDQHRRTRDDPSTPALQTAG